MHRALFLVVLIVPLSQSASPPTLPLEASVYRPASELPSAAPLLTTYWAVSASPSGLVASARYHGGTSLVNRTNSDFFFPTDLNHTITNLAVSKDNPASFAAVANDLIYFFHSNETNCWSAGSFPASAGLSFRLFNPGNVRPLVVRDTLYIGTSKIVEGAAADVGVYALNFSTASHWWSTTFPTITYANFPHMYSNVVRGGDVVFLQTSSTGSSSTTYLYSTSGEDLLVTIDSSDTPNYQLIVVNTTTIMQVSFAMSFFLIPPLRISSTANLTAKLTFSGDLQCSLFEVITAPFFINGNYIYGVCLLNLIVLDVRDLTHTQTAEADSKTLALGATFPDSTSAANKMFLGTAAGKVYRVEMTSTATLTLVFTDPDLALWSGDESEIGTRYLVGYYPMISSAQLLPNKATPMLLIGTRVLDITSTVRGVNPLVATAPIAWQLVLPNFRLTNTPTCDGLHCAIASGTSPTGSSGVVPSLPLQLYSAVALVTTANTTIGEATVPSTPPPFFVWSTPSPAPLGITFDYDGRRTFIASSNGLYATSGGNNPSATLLCDTNVASSTLIAPPMWVYDRASLERNVTYNLTTQVNATINVTMHNETSGLNYTVLVNTTVNQTTTHWRLDPYVVATKAVCYVDQHSVLTCYNTTSSTCSVSKRQLCDASSARVPAQLVPGRVGDGTVVVFCTGATATVSAQVVDVKQGGIVRSFGSASTCGAAGAVDTDEGAMYVPVEQTGAAPSAEPATKRFRVQKYWLNATTGSAAVWSSSFNVSLASNLAIDPPHPTNATAPRGVRALGTSLPQNKIRGYRLSSMALATGNSMDGGSPVVQLDGASESLLALSTRWVRNPSDGWHVYAYLITSSFFAVVNTTSTNGVVPVVLWAPTTSFGRNVGFFQIANVAPIMDHESGVAVVMGSLGPLSFSMRNATFLWQYPFNTSYPQPPPSARLLLTQVNASVVFSTPSGVAVVDARSGIVTFDLSYQDPAVAVGFNGTSARCAAVSGISTGVVDSYKSTPFVAVTYTSAGMFGAPFFIQPYLSSALPPLADAGTEAMRPMWRRTQTISARLSHTVSLSTTFTTSKDGPSASRTASDARSTSVSALQTLTVNPLESRTKRRTASEIPTDTRPSLSPSTSSEISSSRSLPLKVPTGTRTSRSISLSDAEVSKTSGLTVSMRLSPTRASQTTTITQPMTPTRNITFTPTAVLTRTEQLNSSSRNMTLTLSALPTETPIYIPPPTPVPTPAPTPVPPNLAAPPEEPSYAFIAGPVVAFIVLAVAITLALMAKKRRAKKKAEQAFNRLERGDTAEDNPQHFDEDIDEEMNSRGQYQPPPMMMHDDLDARE